MTAISQKPTLMVIDGHSLAFRAFYAVPVENFVNAQGQHTNGVHGFIAMLLSLLRDHEPSHIAVAFDAGSKSFRNREYADYKAGRAETPPEFIGQIPLLKEALTAMGITWLEKEDFEADDILATLAHSGEQQEYRVLVVSGDRDAIQLVNTTTTLLYPSVQGVSRLTHYTPEKVLEKYGVLPQQYQDLAAMVGEKADNLPGVPKVGPKTAAKWIHQFGSLAEILAHEQELPGRVGESFREHRDNAIRNRKLNELLRDVELGVSPEDLVRRPVDADAVREVFARLQFRQLLDRVLKFAAEHDGAPQQEAAEIALELTVRDSLSEPELAQWLHERAGQALGLALRINEDGQIAAAIAAEEEAVTVADAAGQGAFTAWLAGDGVKWMFDAKPVMKAALRVGVDVGGTVLDVQLAAALNTPANPPKQLAELVQQYLGESMPQADPNQLLEVESEGEHAFAAAAWYALRGGQAAQSRLPEATAALFTDVEAPLESVLARMEYTGIRIDVELLRELSQQQGQLVSQYEQEAFAAIGGEQINLGSPKQLQAVLFEKLNMPKTRRTKTGYSTDAQSLEELEAKAPHPFLGALRHHRDANKLKQIIDSLARAVAGDGRIHTNYLQLGAATGRLASSEPNLQNIPIRSAQGQRIRGAFTTDAAFEGLLTADYSQIEMRIMAHLSGDEALIAAFNSGEDTHRFVGSRVFGVAPSEVTASMRSKVKAMSYGLVYGLSAFGLSKQLNVSVDEARELMSGYFARFGKVRDYLRDSVEQARKTGYTETIFGRRRPFPELNSTNRLIRQNAERAALNAPIQGSAADIIKMAMLRVDARMRAERLASRLLLQVHDELVFEVAPGESAALELLVREEMASAAQLRVPLDVSVGRGANWETAGH